MQRYRNNISLVCSIFVGMWVLFTPSLIVAEEMVRAENKGTISLDLQEIDVRKALQLLAKFAKLNLVIENSVQGKISLHLSQVPPHEALESILKLQGLTQHQEGNTTIIRSSIMQSGTLEGKNKLPLETKRIVVKNRDAKELGALFLENQTHKTKGSELSMDTRSNSLWIKDTAERIKELEKLVNAFDQSVQQVLIEGRIVSVNRNFDHSLGVRIGLKPFTAAKENTQSITNITENTAPESSCEPFALNFDLPSLRQSFTKAAPLLFTGFSKLLDLELAAMENEGYGRIISSPHLITTDRTSAVIEAGSEIPYQEKGKYGTSVAFKKAVLSLQVTPEITPSGHILLKLEVHHDKPGTPGAEKTPSIDTQKLKTQVLIQSGETVALGGIYETVSQKSTYRVPLLGKIPLLGRLFSQNNQIEAARELIVFVTPHLVSNKFLKERQVTLHDTQLKNKYKSI